MVCDRLASEQQDREAAEKDTNAKEVALHAKLMVARSELEASSSARDDTGHEHAQLTHKLAGTSVPQFSAKSIRGT